MGWGELPDHLDGPVAPVSDLPTRTPKQVSDPVGLTEISPPLLRRPDRGPTERPCLCVGRIRGRHLRRPDRNPIFFLHSQSLRGHGPGSGIGHHGQHVVGQCPSRRKAGPSRRPSSSSRFPSCTRTCSAQALRGIQVVVQRGRERLLEPLRGGLCLGVVRLRRASSSRSRNSPSRLSPPCAARASSVKSSFCR